MLFGARRAMRGFRTDGRPPALKAGASELKALQAVRAHDRELGTFQPTVAPLLGPYWRGSDSDWEQVERVTSDATSYRRLTVLMRESGLESWLTEMQRLATDGSEELADGTRAGAALGGLRDSVENLARCSEEAVALLQLEQAPWDASEAPWLDSLTSAVSRWQAGLSGLRSWSNYLDARDGLIASGLAALVEGLEDGTVSSGAALSTFERSWRHVWLSEATASDPVLLKFNGAERERLIERFQSLDREILTLASREARSRLCAEVPSQNAPRASGSELSTLVRQMTLKRNHLPIRRLFHAIPTLTTKLKPCFLMSPLSVAQYLDPALENFDVVVFDEASQIPAWEALGAIGRGDQVIVVGDSKQLPPTNFFQKMEGEGVIDEDDFDEMESILDECTASSMPNMRLAWHYRSQHEDLIAFSNHHYYDGSLRTFPAAASRVDGLGVEWRHVPDGFYDRGKSRSNQAEAEALLADVRRRVMDNGSAETIGIVTFSTAQADLINDLKDAAFAKDPAFEKAVEALSEELFVKNLESVQGDERDVMLFSICYGPDRVGRVALNFGPLNRTGGERRLNVAVTRARRQTVVFSTLTADQIDLRRTNAVGVRHLKAYLRYAEHGPASLNSEELAPLVDADSPFEEDVQAAVEKMGYQVARLAGLCWVSSVTARPTTTRAPLVSATGCDRIFWSYSVGGSTAFGPPTGGTTIGCGNWRNCARQSNKP
ncbi:MAG: hypothetical protein ACI9OJ_003890 [Myxococcota bacterium]|jgi:hypothetical protein